MFVHRGACGSDGGDGELAANRPAAGTVCRAGPTRRWRLPPRRGLCRRPATNLSEDDDGIASHLRRGSPRSARTRPRRSVGARAFPMAARVRHGVDPEATEPLRRGDSRLVADSGRIALEAADSSRDRGDAGRLAPTDRPSAARRAGAPTRPRVSPRHRWRSPEPPPAAPRPSAASNSFLGRDRPIRGGFRPTPSSSCRRLSALIRLPGHGLAGQPVRLAPAGGSRRSATSTGTSSARGSARGDRQSASMRSSSRATPHMGRGPPRSSTSGRAGRALRAGNADQARCGSRLRASSERGAPTVWEPSPSCAEAGR